MKCNKIPKSIRIKKEDIKAKVEKLKSISEHDLSMTYLFARWMESEPENEQSHKY